MRRKSTVLQRQHRVANLADDKQVFVAIDDAAVHMSWLKQP